MHSPLRRGPRIAVLLAFAALVPGAASADPVPSFSTLVDQTLARSPDLAEAQARINQAQALADQAGLRPNPNLSGEIENFAGSGPFSGFRGSEVTASVEQTFELGGKRTARISAGRAEVEATRAQTAQARATLIADLADAYVQAAVAEVRVSAAEEAVTLAQEDLRIVTALVEAGKEADLRTVQGRAAVQLAQADLAQARSARTVALLTLTSATANPEPFTSIDPQVLIRVGRAPSAAAFDAATSPAVITAQAERAAAARRVEVERTRRTPDVVGSVGIRRLGGDDATALVAGISVPLQIFDRNRGGVAAAEADLRALDARLSRARLDAEAGVRAALSIIAAAQQNITATELGEDAADEAYRLSRTGYEGGKLSQAEVNNARRALTEARAQTLNARLERLEAEIRLARLQGARPLGDQ